MENLVKQGQPKWIPGTIVERMRSVMYCVQVSDNIWKRHADQLRFKNEVDTGVIEREPQMDDNTLKILSLL